MRIQKQINTKQSLKACSKQGKSKNCGQAEVKNIQKVGQCGRVQARTSRKEGERSQKHKLTQGKGLRETVWSPDWHH